MTCEFDICQTCFTRANACLDCYEKKLDKAEALTVYAIETRDAELAAKDKEIETLKAQIAAMRRCEICKHYDNNYHDAPCVCCADKTDLPKWELDK